MYREWEAGKVIQKLVFFRLFIGGVSVLKAIHVRISSAQRHKWRPRWKWTMLSLFGGWQLFNFGLLAAKSSKRQEMSSYTWKVCRSKQYTERLRSGSFLCRSKPPLPIRGEPVVTCSRASAGDSGWEEDEEGSTTRVQDELLGENGRSAWTWNTLCDNGIPLVSAKSGTDDGMNDIIDTRRRDQSTTPASWMTSRDSSRTVKLHHNNNIGYNNTENLQKKKINIMLDLTISMLHSSDY